MEESTPLDNIALDAATIDLIESAGITTVEELAVARVESRKISGIGSVGESKIDEALAEYEADVRSGSIEQALSDPAPEEVAEPEPPSEPKPEVSGSSGKKFKVRLSGGAANFPEDEIEAVDESEAISKFIIKHGVRDSARYRRRVTPVE